MWKNLFFFYFPTCASHEWKRLTWTYHLSSAGTRTAVASTRRQAPAPAVTRITIIRRWRITSLAPTTLTARRPTIPDRRRRRSRTPLRLTHPRPSPQPGCSPAWSLPVSSASSALPGTHGFVNPGAMRKRYRMK